MDGHKWGLYLARTEDKLPLRGLSAFYGGKAKTFKNINEVESVMELAKKEHAINKSRSLETTLKGINRKRKFPASVPLINLEEDDEELHVVDEERPRTFLKRCFSASDIKNCNKQLG